MLVLNWPKELLLHSMSRKTAYYADFSKNCQRLVPLSGLFRVAASLLSGCITCQLVQGHISVRGSCTCAHLLVSYCFN
jgi:hypothetical protein